MSWFLTLKAFDDPHIALIKEIGSNFHCTMYNANMAEWAEIRCSSFDLSVSI